MADRTLLTKTTGPGRYSTTGAAVTMVAADTANKNRFVATGNDIIIAHNTGDTPATVTINSAPDPYGRTGDVAAQSLAAGEIRVFYPALLGWVQPSGHIHLEASAADVKFGVISLVA